MAHSFRCSKTAKLQRPTTTSQQQLLKASEASLSSQFLMKAKLTKMRKSRRRAVGCRCRASQQVISHSVIFVTFSRFHPFDGVDAVQEEADEESSSSEGKLEEASRSIYQSPLTSPRVFSEEESSGLSSEEDLNELVPEVQSGLTSRITLMKIFSCMTGRVAILFYY